MEYLGRVKMTLSSNMSGNNFADPVNTRKAHEELMTQGRTKAIHISTKYKVQIEPLHFEWCRFPSMTEKDFPDILNKILSHNGQQEPSNLNEDRSMPQKNREKYNWFRRGIDNRTRTLTTLSQSVTYPNMTNRLQHILHSVAETPNTYSTNGYLMNHTYRGTQNRRQTYHTTPFRMPNKAHKQHDVYHRESPMSNNWFYGTSPCEYYSNAFLNSNIMANDLETLPKAGGTIYKGNLISSVMIQQTIIQPAPSSIETFDCTKSILEALAESIENTAKILGQNTICIAFSKMTGSLLSSANRSKAQLPNLTWTELKRELSIQYSVILSNSHARHAFAWLKHGPDELLDM